MAAALRLKGFGGVLGVETLVKATGGGEVHVGRWTGNGAWSSAAAVIAAARRGREVSMEAIKQSDRYVRNSVYRKT